MVTTTLGTWVVGGPCGGRVTIEVAVPISTGRVVVGEVGNVVVVVVEFRDTGSPMFTSVGAWLATAGVESEVEVTTDSWVVSDEAIGPRGCSGSTRVV